MTSRAIRVDAEVFKWLQAQVRVLGMDALKATPNDVLRKIAGLPPLKK